MILGFVVTVLFLIECSFGLWKKIWIGKLSPEFMRKCHKGIGILTIVVAMVHLISILGLLKQRPISMLVSGSLALLCMTITVILGLGKLSSSKLKYHKGLAVLALFCVCVHVYSGISSLFQYQDAVQNIQISDIDMEEIADGVYQGEWNVGYIYAKVQVTVSEGVIAKIDLLEHHNERGESAELIVDRVVEKQSLDVDAVSGATNSSNVIKKAVEHALKSAIK